MQKIVANESQPMNRTLPPPNHQNKIDNSLAYHAQPPAPPAPITTSPQDGTITIPAASFSSKNASAPVSVMKSFLDGTQLLSNGCTSSVGPPCFYPESSSFTYEVTVGSTSAADAAGGPAGTYYLTANFSTWHMDQDLNVSVNGGETTALGMFWTKGWWNETQPVEVTLKEGKNTLVFTRSSGRDVMYKEFLLYKGKKPSIPPPPGNYTPTPAPPMPSASSYIQVAASTTCEKQGIAMVPEELCGHAALALGLKYTGVRTSKSGASVQPGCFAVVSGPYKGNSNYNANAKAACTTTPCDTAQICIRK